MENSTTSALSKNAINGRPQALQKMQSAIAASRQRAIQGLMERHPATEHSGAKPLAAGSMQEAVFEIATLFPEATEQQLSRLQLALHALYLPPGADRCPIAYALASASSGDIERGMRALQTLHSGLKFDEWANAGPDAALAWRMASILSTTESGFALLKNLHPIHATFGRAEKILLQTFGRTSLGHSDARISLAERAACAAWKMQTRLGELAPAEKAAVFAWEQGFREDGPGTPLDLAQRQLAKFARKTVTRVCASRLKSFLPRLLGKKKSPLSALQQGLQGAQRPSLAMERASIAASLAKAQRCLETDSQTDSLTPLQSSDGKEGLAQLPWTAIQIADTAKSRNLPPSHSVWRDLKDAENIGTAFTFRPKKRSRQSVRQSLRMLVDSMESSARLRLSDGARRGFSTKGLSINLANLLHLTGIPLGPRLNIGQRRARRAVVEIGRTSQGGEIFIGSERALRRNCGLGIMLGYDFHLGPAQLRAGVSADVDNVWEKRALAGVVLRVAQRKTAKDGTDTARMKTGMQRILDFLFLEKNREKSASAADIFERFAVIFFDDPDVSIGWTAPDTRTGKRSASLSGAARVKLPGSPIAIGPGLGIEAASTRVTQKSRGETTGRLQNAANRCGQSREVTFSMGLKGKLSLEAGERPGHAPVGIGILEGGLPTWTVPLYAKGFGSRVRLTRENGQLQPASCTLDVEMTSVTEYVDALLADRKLWIGRLLARHASATDPEKSATEEFDRYLNRIKNSAKRNQTFIQRANLREDIARAIDVHTEAAMLIQQNSHLSTLERDRLCAARESACLALISQPGAWLPVELKVLEKSASTVRYGLLAGLQLSTDTATEGEHQLDGLKIGNS